MKILRIAILLLVPALGFVSCDKSNMRPCNKPAQESTGNSSASDVSSKSGSINSDEDQGTTIVGSGDDDRDGGDKKKRR